MEFKNDKETELEWLEAFIRRKYFGYPESCEHLRSLWIAYCLHMNLYPYTTKYNTILSKLWNDNENLKSVWDNFPDFAGDLSGFLF